jgi:DNA-binding MarR family transcriptional regulator
MRINPSWSAGDIAQQAGTTISYVYNRLRVYRAQGFIKRYGVETISGARVRIWRLTAEASKQIDLPKAQEYSPDPLVVAAVRLNKLVCQGLVRFVDERLEAMTLCNEILKGLGETYGESAQV